MVDDITPFGDESGMGFHGSVGQLDPTQENWKTYSSRLEFYFVANDAEDPLSKELSC